ncbi:hypothetical protein Clacol_003105 [Clathrus columnatus]|uniref:Uncharacterized protein n=1 Tax=Clathrus columnatus TaxID=1419009 RepID=A0AAV5A7D6_9AGAM|nr:hypothetical protein Clacol_003105 [Clathrus columnatus]
MEMEGKGSTLTRGTTVPETQSLLGVPSYPPTGNTTEGFKKETEVDDFPEGGAKAWASVIGSFFMVFLSQGAIYAFGVYQDFYTQRIRIPRFFMLSLAQPHNYYQVFLSQGVGVGLGMGLVYLPSVMLGFHYFKRRRGVAIGIVSTGSAVGGICQTIGLNHLINGKVGFAWGVRIFGFIFLVLAIIGNVLMRPRLPPRRLRPSQPKPDVKKIVRDIPLLLSILGFVFGYATFIESFFVLVAQPVAGAIVDAPRYKWNRAIIAVNEINHLLRWVGYDFGISYDVGQTEEDMEEYKQYAVNASVIFSTSR